MEEGGEMWRCDARAVERGEIRKIDPTIGQFNFFPVYPLRTNYRAQTHMQKKLLSPFRLLTSPPWKKKQNQESSVVYWWKSISPTRSSDKSGKSGRQLWWWFNSLCVLPHCALLTILYYTTTTTTTSTQTILDVIRTLTVGVNTENAAASTTELLKKEDRGWKVPWSGAKVDRSQQSDSLGAAARAIPSVCANRSRRSRLDRLSCRRHAFNEQQLHGKVS